LRLTPPADGFLPLSGTPLATTALKRPLVHLPIADYSRIIMSHPCSDIDLTLSYQLAGPTHLCFNVEAAHSASQRIVRESLTLSPAIAARTYREDGSGNRFVRFDAGPGELRLRYQARVERITQPAAQRLPEVPVTAVPDKVLPYLMPSRYCESDVMSRSAQQIFGDVEPGYARVKAVTDWVHESLTYLPGSTTSTTTAQEVFVLRAGVCRDFAHLGITMCRALNIPARLVVGYVNFEEPPQDFHAIFEAWLGGRWVLFDPTGMAPVDRLVRIGTGRDAKDVAFATLFGPAVMTSKNIVVKESECDASSSNAATKTASAPAGHTPAPSARQRDVGSATLETA
jgi:transglutaminase-like putative cysteine protease